MTACDACQRPNGVLFVRVFGGTKAFLCLACVEEQGRQIRAQLYRGDQFRIRVVR